MAGLRRPSGAGRRLRLLGTTAVLMLILAGCTVSPEASRVPGEPGGGRRQPRQSDRAIGPPDRFDRVYYNTPYDGPHIAKPDTSPS